MSDNSLNLDGFQQQGSAGGSGTPGNIFDGTQTYSDQELANPANILVTITDTQTPIVVLFGARTSGKTMMLIRLTRYLKQKGFSVMPDRVFRPAYDSRYATLCNNFEQVVYSDTTQGGTGVVNFMLVKVLDKVGRPICQILEAPGEHYFDPKMPNMNFPGYMQRIINAPNRKKWIFIVEKDWGNDQAMRNMYAQKICAHQQQVSPADKVLFVCNKVDAHPAMFLPNTRPNVPQFKREITQQYPGIFSRYLNNNPISKLWNPENYDFIPFSAGTFSQGESLEYYNPGKDFYPEMLWNAIRK